MIIIQLHHPYYIRRCSLLIPMSNVVCRSVTVVSPAKTAELIEMPFGLVWGLCTIENIPAGISNFLVYHMSYSETSSNWHRCEITYALVYRMPHLSKIISQNIIQGKYRTVSSTGNVWPSACRLVYNAGMMLHKPDSRIQQHVQRHTTHVLHIQQHLLPHQAWSVSMTAAMRLVCMFVSLQWF